MGTNRLSLRKIHECGNTMKRGLILGFIVISSLFSGCTVNLGTKDNTATNSTSPPQPAAGNQVAVTPKKLAAETTKKPPTAAGTSNTVRVQFAKGETSTAVTKDIPANGSIDFLMNVQKGQTMSYTVGYDFKDSDIEAFLTEPGIQDISQSSGPKAPNDFLVKKSGDHRLTVNNTSGKKVTITLYLDVQ